MEKNQILEELKWRGLYADSIGCIAENLKEGEKFYIGTDPSSVKKENLNPKHPEITSSLHIGHLAAFMTAKLLQKHGLQPIVLVGTATALMGDPSGKTAERALLDEESMAHNAECIKAQLRKLIDFNEENPNGAIMVSNNDWMKDFSFVQFSRDVLKYITLNYMLAKESIKQRISREGSGISLTETLYGPIQAYDFLHLREKYGCKIQLAGRDQVGNAATGIELARKSKGITDLSGVFIPLICDENGNKFGKSNDGKNIFLDKHLTPVYTFYQFWLNQSDTASENLIKQFTLLDKEVIENLIKEHRTAPHKRLLQKTLAKEVTTMIHGVEECDKVINASELLFSNDNLDFLETLEDEMIEAIFDGCPKFEIDKTKLEGEGIDFVDATVEAKFFKSKGDLRKLINSGGVSINKIKVSKPNCKLKLENLIKNKFIVVQQGKKKHNLIIAK